MVEIQDRLNISDILGSYEEAVRLAFTIRKVEETLLELFKLGKLFGTVHTCIGQEFVGVAVAKALKPQDTLFSNHRCHGHFIAYCQDLLGLIGEVMGKSVGVCGGRGGSQHLHRDGFYSNGIQGGIVPVAAGLALAHQIRATDAISVVFIGDGTLGEGVLYETMNIAAKWKLPVLFVCENNLYAQSTQQAQTLAGNIVDRAKAFGIDTAHGDTWDWQQLMSQINNSVQVVRSESKPVFHLVDTYRLMAHSKGDDDRSEEEISSYWERDPLNKLLAQYADDARLGVMIAEIESAIAEAVSVADEAPFADLEIPLSAEGNIEWGQCNFQRERVVDSVRRGLREGLREHANIMLMGEDIEAPYGGAFKCTAGLSEEFPERVRNTPISEASIVGIGNGLALSGLIPVVEIMFGDFLTLAADQWINHAAKFSWMYNDKVCTPIIVRTPMGGKRGYAATHSQSIEKHFVGLPGTTVLALHHRYSPAMLYGKLFSTINQPTLVVENKILYGHYVDSMVPNGFSLRCTGDKFPIVNLHPSLPADLTIVAIGGMSIEAEQAVMVLFEEEELLIDLYLPTQLYPLSIEPMVSSLEKTGALLVVEEGQEFVGIGSEIIAQAAEALAGQSLRCARLAAFPSPIPASRPLEDRCLPNARAIITKALEVLGG